MRCRGTDPDLLRRAIAHVCGRAEQRHPDLTSVRACGSTALKKRSASECVMLTAPQSHTRS
jgi:hypothetical protein